MIFVAILEWIKSLGIPRCKWQNNIKYTLKQAVKVEIRFNWLWNGYSGGLLETR
jgi:hypothetical protein